MTDGMGDNKSPNSIDEKKPLKDEEETNGDITMPDEGLDSSKVKFINGGAAADLVVDIDGNTKVPEQEFVGLTKEELLRYADDPYWVKVRWVMLILFWVAWLAMLAAAIIIIVLAPKCPPRPKLDWWQKSVVYQVYPRSFQDSNGDGVGDLKGIEQNLDYLRHKLNVTAVWMNPIYPSPMKDFGYDITDYQDVDPIFGTLEDFENLRVAMHKKGIKLIMDLIPNHVSDQHQWFQESIKGGDDNKYKDFFIWHEGKPKQGGGQPDPPNNWLGVFGQSAWTWNDQRKAYYYHQFLPEQPDLNLHNDDVKAEIKNALEFWLVKGVDGFRIDAAAHLYETVNVTMDEPPSGAAGVTDDEYDSLLHPYTTFQPESYQFITELREIVDSYQEVDGKARCIIVEAYGTNNQTMGFYSYDGQEGAHMPLNMNLVNLKEGCDAKCVKDHVQQWMTEVPMDHWTSWVLGNHDNSRMASRMGEEWVNAVNMLQLTLPGTPFIYYGDEIGMGDVDISWEDTQDPAGKRAGQDKYRLHSRDPERTPMQWSGELNAGFSTANKTWLPVSPDYPERNVKAQLAHGAGVSNVEVFSSLTVLRQEPSFQWGILEYAVVDDNILSYVRQAEGFTGYLVAINFGEKAATVNFNGASPKFVPKDGVIAAHTANFDVASRNEDYALGNVAKLTGVYLKPTEGVVFWWDWGAPDIKNDE